MEKCHRFCDSVTRHVPTPTTSSFLHFEYKDNIRIYRSGKMVEFGTLENSFEMSSLLWSHCYSNWVLLIYSRLSLLFSFTCLFSYLHIKDDEKMYLTLCSKSSLHLSYIKIALLPDLFHQSFQFTTINDSVSLHNSPLQIPNQAIINLLLNFSPIWSY